jgi:protein-glucosylgalactosylhydroxylysine glucosidase
MRRPVSAVVRRWQALADAAFFYLHSSAHASSPSSTSMFGLSDWPDYQYYRGHVMWDIEAFALPPLLVTDPHTARSLLEFRAERLQAACANAELMGYRGAQFP